MNQHRRIERRLPSPASPVARTSPHGVVFKSHVGSFASYEQDFIPTDEVAKFVGDVDSWVAHMLLWRCCGCVEMVEGR